MVPGFHLFICLPLESRGSCFWLRTSGRGRCRFLGGRGLQCQSRLYHTPGHLFFKVSGPCSPYFPLICTICSGDRRKWKLLYLSSVLPLPHCKLATSDMRNGTGLAHLCSRAWDICENAFGCSSWQSCGQQYRGHAHISCPVNPLFLGSKFPDGFLKNKIILEV